MVWASSAQHSSREISNRTKSVTNLRIVHHRLLHNRAYLHFSFRKHDDNSFSDLLQWRCDKWYQMMCEASKGGLKVVLRCWEVFVNVDWSCGGIIKCSAAWALELFWSLIVKALIYRLENGSSRRSHSLGISAQPHLYQPQLKPHQANPSDP